MQQPRQPRCSQHAHPYKAIAIFHPPGFERGRCNKQPRQPRCSQHAHPYKAIAIFHPPSFERGRCNNLCNLSVHNMLISIQSCCHFSSKDDTSLGVGSPKVFSKYIPQFYKARRLGLRHRINPCEHREDQPSIEMAMTEATRRPPTTS